MEGVIMNQIETVQCLRKVKCSDMKIWVKPAIHKLDQKNTYGGDIDPCSEKEDGSSDCEAS